MWQAYWFRQAPLFNLAVCRIVCVGTQTIMLSWDHNVLVVNSKLPDLFYNPLFILRMILWPLNLSFQPPFFRPSTEVVLAIYWATLAVGVLSFLGALTRISLPLFAFGNLFLIAFKWSFQEYHHPDALMAIFLCVLALSPAGRVLSLDDLTARLRKAVRQQGFEPVGMLDTTSRFACFPLLLGQHLLAIAYLNAAAAKVVVGGLEWMNGYTLQYYVSRDALTRGSEFGLWLGEQHALAIILSWVTILFEGTFFLGLIFSSLIWIYLPVGLALHAGMCIAQVACFYQYCALYAVFVPWADLARRSSRGLRGDKLRVVFDGGCVLCVRSMTFVEYWDWFHRLKYIDIRSASPEIVEAAGGTIDIVGAEMLAVRPDGVTRKGFFAWRDVLFRLPVFWPFLLILWIPGMSLLGPKVYRRTAATRARFGSCQSGVCSAGCR
jgi:predicted DCC family thiol-disulfide oxidoreductase YuxK